MKRIRAVFVLVLLLGLTLFSVPAFADDGYVIDSYDTVIDVGADNRFQVTETIVCDFLESRHGIIRYIPTRGQVVRTDGSSDTMRAKVKSLTVSGAEYSASSEGNYRVIKIGDPDRTITGKQKYVIKYTYDIGEDLRKNEDEFYYNIIGDKWTTSVSGVTFTVNMPKSFDAKKIGFAVTNESVETIPNVLEYSVDGNAITGKMKRTLKAREALTMRVTLPEGYFERKTNVLLKYLYLAVAILSGLASTVMFILRGRDEKPVKTVELYPPEGMNPAECELYFREEVTTRGITSLIVHMANQGFLSIRDAKRKKDMEFVLEGPYEGKSKEEQKLFNAIFSRAVKGEDGKESVTIGDLEYRLSGTYQQITDMYSTKKDSLFREGTVEMKGIFIALTGAAAYMVTFLQLFRADLGIVVSLMFAIPSLIGAAAFSYLIGKKGVLTKILAFAGALGFLAFFMFASAVAQASIPLSLASYAVILVGGFFASFMQAKNRAATEVLGKVLGFREFLKTAEKDRIRALAEENPQYFYDVMPYTYALDVDSTWMRKLKGIEIAPPDWYSGRDDLYYWMLYDRMDRMNSGMRSAAMPEPDLDSGGYGGFSGGGGSISGGGFGGGGGSSW